MKNKKTLAVLIFVLLISAVLASVMASPIAHAETNSVTRQFNESYDRMLQDFSEHTDAVGAYLSVDWDNNNKTPGDAIYKAAANIGELAVSVKGILNIEMRGTAKLSDMQLVLRHKNDANLCFVPFEDLLDIDENSLPELTENWQMYSISLMAISANWDDQGSTAFTAEDVTGFHIIANAETTGHLEINSIHFGTTTDYNNSASHKIDSFEGNPDVNSKREDIYWCGSETGKIIVRHIEINDSAVITGTANNLDSKYDNIVLGIKGSGAVTVAPYTDAAGEAVAWSQLLDSEGNAVSQLSDTYNNIVISLSSLGEKAINGIKITVTQGQVDIYSVFFTNMKSIEPAYEYPRLDLKNAFVFDDFFYSQTGINGDYEEMSTAQPALDSKLYYRLSYSKGENISVENGTLVIDGTTLGAEEFINFKTATSALPENAYYNYIVLKIKGIDGASLDTFRMSGDGTSNYVWMHSLYSAPGHLAAGFDDASYPYKTDDGFMYLIIDRAACAMDFSDTFDMYYSGTGKLIIDEILFANAFEQSFDYENAIIVSEERTLTPSATGYEYLGHVDLKNTNQQYLAITIKGTESITLDSIRLEFVAADSTTHVRWFTENAQGTLLDVNGDLMPVLTSEFQTYYIDLVKSEVPLTLSGFHIHSGVEKLGGSFVIKSIEYLNYKIENETKILDSEKSYTPTGDGYAYVAGFDIVNKDLNGYMSITVKASENSDLSAMRFEFVGTDNTSYFRWFEDNAQGALLDQFGNMLPKIGEEYKTYILSFAKMGVEPSIKAMHIHSAGSATGTLSIKEIKLINFAPSYTQLMTDMPLLDHQSPVITLNLPQTAKEGDEITVSPTITDNVSQAENITITIIVKLGAKEIVNTQSQSAKFTAEAGTYTITVTAVDEAGLETTEVRQITVAKAEAEQPQKPNTVLIVAIALGVAAILVGAGVYFKKRKA